MLYFYNELLKEVKGYISGSRESLWSEGYICSIQCDFVDKDFAISMVVPFQRCSGYTCFEWLNLIQQLLPTCTDRDNILLKVS